MFDYMTTFYPAKLDLKADLGSIQPFDHVMYVWGFFGLALQVERAINVVEKIRRVETAEQQKEMPATRPDRKDR